MKVFVTGASGHIGSEVTKELLANGHQVVGLARSDESAEKLKALGAEVQLGTIDDLDILRSATAASDGVIHCAFNNGGLVSGMAAVCAQDRAAIQAMCEALEGTDKPFVQTSGTAMLAPGSVASEEDLADSERMIRAASEEVTVSFATKGVRTSVMRLPFSVHSGELDKHGFIPSIIGFARDKGQSAYVGNGTNHWPAVHVLDAAVAYRLALESAPAGSRLHAVGDEGIEFRDIAEAIGKQLNVETVSVTPEDAPNHFTWMALFAGMDTRASSAKTQELLNWHPVQPGLIADIETGNYFETN
jgi:nucleoside-diphosphate-sugar epimerase